MKSNISASIIVLNYNGEKSVSETIDSLIKLDFFKNKYEIIVVDNNSQDNSRQIINNYTKKYPKLIKTLYLSKNLGFAGGNNQAIKIAKGEYIVLLNNDCLADKNWLKELVKLAKTDPKIFSVTSKILRYPSNLNEIQNAGSILFQDGYGRDIGAIVTSNREQLYEKDIGQFDKTKEVYSSCGAALLFNKEILNKIGYLDEKFFMYYEDAEISERARLCGYKNIYCPKAKVWHHHAASSHEWSAFFIYNVEKGRLLHIFYHFPLKIFFQQYFLFTLKSKLRLFRSILKRKNITKSWQYLKVSFYFFLHFPKLISKRFSYSLLYPSNNRKINYQKILSGYWYFN